MHHTARFVVLSCLAAAFAAGAAAAAEWPASGPPLLYERALQPPSEGPHVDEAGTEPEPDAAAAPSRRYAPFHDHRRFPEKNAGKEVDQAASDIKREKRTGRKAGERMEWTGISGADAPAATEPPPQEPPTPEAVENYRIKLEQRLLERYNNLPAHAGKVYQVRIVAAKPPEASLDGRFIRAEFDQLVYDIWGRRIPALEQEYYVVTFGAGGVEQVRSDPSIRVGLDMEKTYSERSPLAADPFRNVQEYEAFKDDPKTGMPGWWRPDFPELR